MRIARGNVEKPTKQTKNYLYRSRKLQIFALQFLPVIAPAVHPLCPGFPARGRSPSLNRGGCSSVASFPLQPAVASASRALGLCRGSETLLLSRLLPGLRTCLMLHRSLSLLVRADWLQPLLVLLPKWRLQSSSRLLTATYWIIVEYIYA